jgi:hypothetical protein
MRKILLSLALMIAVHLPGVTCAQTAVSTEIAPTGKLRIGMNASTTTGDANGRRKRQGNFC